MLGPTFGRLTAVTIALPSRASGAYLVILPSTRPCSQDFASIRMKNADTQQV